jgi:hypothetical protein
VLLHDDADCQSMSTDRQQRQKCNNIVSTCCTDIMLDLGKHAELLSAAGGQQRLLGGATHAATAAAVDILISSTCMMSSAIFIVLLQASYQKVNRHATVKMMLCCGCSLLFVAGVD